MNIKRLYKLVTGNMPLHNNTLDAEFEKYWDKREQVDKQIVRREKRINYRMNLIAEELEDNSTILDIGCGNGDLLSIIHKKQPNAKLLGIDISSDAVNKTQMKGFRAIEVDITQINLRELGSYDYIIMSEIIEHISNPERIILDIKKITRKKIIITTPNIAFILFRLRLFFWGKFPISTVFHIREHLCFWSVKDFLYWADYLGFNIIKLYSLPEIPMIRFNRIMPNLFGNHMIYVLEPKKE